jgi:hypothetical protein
MTSTETLNMKFSVNKLRFPLDTHTVDSDERFDSFGVLKPGQVVEHFLDRLDIQAND